MRNRKGYVQWTRNTHTLYINKILHVYAADEAAICFLRRKLTMNYILN